MKHAELAHTVSLGHLVINRVSGKYAVNTDPGFLRLRSFLVCRRHGLSGAN